MIAFPQFAFTIGCAPHLRCSINTILTWQKYVWRRWNKFRCSVGIKLRRMEVSISSITAVVCFISANSAGLPLVIPDADSAAFVGLHYLYPLIAISIFGIVSTINKRGSLNGFDRSAALVSIFCYATVIYAYFSVKLWMPHIRDVTFDRFLWSVDLHLYGIVQACMEIRRGLSPLIPYDANAYMLVYIAAFYVGLIGQARLAPDHLRELILACIVMQIIGTLGYLAFPAVGPFIYERGINPVISRQQQGMWEFYQNSLAFGPTWLRTHASSAFTAGLAAMPSLHVSGMTLFFLNACRRTRPLAPLFGVLLVFIAVSSIANRWHYILDVPAGALVAFASLWLAEKLIAWDRDSLTKLPPCRADRLSTSS